MSEEVKEDLVGNRLTLVPALAVYGMDKRSSQVRGRLGVTASNITCVPKETDTERSLGTWSAGGAELKVMLGAADCGPRSGRATDYVEKVVGRGRHKMMISTGALLGAMEGRTVWGDTGEKAARLLAWKWSFDDIHEIRTGRLKKMFKMWDVELVIASNDPKATLVYSGLGADAHVFSTYDSTAKAAKLEGSDLLGFANTLAQAVARHRGCQVKRRTDGTNEPTDVFTFA